MSTVCVLFPIHFHFGVRSDQYSWFSHLYASHTSFFIKSGLLHIGRKRYVDYLAYRPKQEKRGENDLFLKEYYSAHERYIRMST